MKQHQSRLFKLYHFQDQFNRPDCKAVVVVGLGKAQINTDKKIGIHLAQSYKSGWVMLMNCSEVTEEQLKEILQEYLTEDESEKFIFRRDEELFDQFDIFKHLVKDQYLAILPRGQIVQFVKEERIEKIILEEGQQVIDEFLTNLGLEEQNKQFNAMRILNDIKDQLDGGLPELNVKSEQKQFKSMEERVEYESEMKLFNGEALFEIPKFDKNLIHYDWDNMQQIPKQLLNSQ